MTDTQESVVVNQNTNGQRFGFLRRLVNNCIASEWSFYITIAALVVVGVALSHDHAIKSLEASFETTVERMLDKEKAFIKEVIQKFETNMVRKFEEHRRLSVGKNCAELFKFGKTISGVYKINPDGAGPDFEVFCDQETAGGGWIVIQKRFDGTIDFRRNWSDYKNGFGNVGGEFWLGLEKIQRLTKSQSKLRVDLEDFDGNAAYADYNMFSVANESKKYQLSVGTYSGTAGDSFTYHHDCPFTTKDQDNDGSIGNCAKKYLGAWWFRNCHFSHLNGYYHHRKHSSFAEGVNWFTWKGSFYSVRRAEMKIRPVEF